MIKKLNVNTKVLPNNLKLKRDVWCGTGRLHIVTDFNSDTKEQKESFQHYDSHTKGKIDLLDQKIIDGDEKYLKERFKKMDKEELEKYGDYVRNFGRRDGYQADVLTQELFKKGVYVGGVIDEKGMFRFRGEKDADKGKKVELNQDNIERKEDTVVLNGRLDRKNLKEEMGGNINEAPKKYKKNADRLKFMVRGNDWAIVQK